MYALSAETVVEILEHLKKDPVTDLYVRVNQALPVNVQDPVPVLTPEVVSQTT